jgi:PhoPQ-activated pathogenicity-related protein
MQITPRRILKPLGILAFFVATLSALAADPLERYVAAPDNSFQWTLKSRENTNGFTTSTVSMTSQTWRTSAWTHTVQIVRPNKMRHPEIAFLFVTGDGSGKNYIPMLARISSEAGAIAALVTRVPNQPLYGGKKEDALIAYTFLQYVKTGDDTWPALLPMVKSAVRAMDTVQAYAKQEHKENIEKFVVAGASKRGWTTWLTGAVDPRVAAIAPMVIDMLNMKVQTQWAQKVYGKQSDQIRDYTELNLVDKMDDPRMVELRGFVDPYSYRGRYTNIPKLLLLGTNDPYWTVDSLRHYWNDLPGEKLVFQTPNAGHNLNGGLQAIDALAAFFQMIADKEELPKVWWKFNTSVEKPELVFGLQAKQGTGLNLLASESIQGFRLWTADSPDRDFRNDRWTHTETNRVQPPNFVMGTGARPSTAVIHFDLEKPATGYRAFMGEVILTNRLGHEYKLSTQVQVVPDEVN